MDNNEIKKTIDNLKNEEIDGTTTKGGTSIDKGTSFGGTNSVPVDLGGGTGVGGPGETSTPFGISGNDQMNVNSDIKPLNDFSSDSLSSSDMGNADA